MAVESRFVVIRHGVEVQTFMDKKAADDYDKMLDMADNISTMLDASPLELNDDTKEELSIYLAQNREDVLVALQAKKAKPIAKKAEVPVVPTTSPITVSEPSAKPAPSKATKRTTKTTAKESASLAE